MKRLFFWFNIIILSILSSNCVAQQDVTFHYLSKMDGLSQSSVFSITQDSTGFLWFGTRNGLNRYDGYQFRVYTKDTSLNSIVGNDIRELYITPQSKTLWIGTISGLSMYQESTDNFLNFRHNANDSTSLSSNLIREIFQDSKGNLWIGTERGINLYNKEHNSFKRIPIKGIKSVKAIVEDQQGQIFIGTNNGVFTMHKNKQHYSFIKIKLDKDEIHVSSLVVDSDNNLWIGTKNNGVIHRKSDTITIYQASDQKTSISHNTIRSMCLDKNNNLWVGTLDGLNFLKSGSEEFSTYRQSFNDRIGLSDNSIHSTFIDKQNSLWIGTYYGGLNHLDATYNRFANFKKNQNKNSLSTNVVSSFAEDKDGNLWIGTEGGALNHYNIKQNKFTRFNLQTGNENMPSGENVKQLLLEQDNLWIGTFQAGLFNFDIQDKTLTQFIHDPKNKNSLSNNNVYGLLKRASYLWISTYGGGLDIYDLEHKTFHHNKHRNNDTFSISSNLTRVILQSKENIWIGTDNGLNKVTYDINGLPKQFQTSLKGKKIFSLYNDEQNQLWIGTFNNGLYSLNLKTNKFDHYTTKDGLPSNTVFGILETGSDLWLSTNNGLSKFDKNLQTFTNYNSSNGPENLVYNYNAYYKMKDERLIFGGLKGFTLFNPESLAPNKFKAPLVLTEIYQNNKKIDIGTGETMLRQNINQTNEITLKYNKANFSIHFASLDFRSPKSNKYAYKLDGLDLEWTYSNGISQVHYTIQKEGSYLFRLKASNSDGIWNPNEKTLQITVLPPAWRTWWAYLIYIIFLLGIFLALVRFIKLRHKLELQQIAKQQQEDLHEVKLRFFTNITHEFRTPLTLILGPIKDLIRRDHEGKNQQLKIIERNAQKLLNLVNQILSFRKLSTDHEPLRVVHQNVILFLKEIFLLFKENAKLKNIDYQFMSTTDELIIWYDSDKLERVFFNLLSNAFKYTPDSGKIKMHIERINDAIKIQIIDNGIGIESELQAIIFERYFESNTKQSAIKGTGIGLAIAKQMVKLHKGKIYVTSKPNIETTFSVELPIGKHHFKSEEIVVEQKPAIGILSIHQTQNEEKTKDKIKTNTQGKSLHKLLIIEDNLEVQNYIHQIFKSQYLVITANNGAEGLTKIKINQPDIIITDVMMPIMDGITMCQKIKADIEISHIPIILLTARTASIFKIEGLQTGADDYITKPFDPEELLLRVRNIIASRQNFRDKFPKILSLDPKEINITSTDEHFLENALKIVETHIGNHQLNVQFFASELAVSRALLFTKLKALTGQTPNNFIKTIRLKRAAQLLKTKKLNISQVSYMVGFKDPKYFRKCFLAQFGQTPSKFKDL